VPAALGTDHDVRIDADGNGFGMGRRIQDNFDIVEIGKDKFATVLKRTKAEPSPEIQKTLLRMAVEAPVSLGTA